jgi:curved DNA-binding protein
MPKDYYKTLGVDKGASKDEIKTAFRKLAHQYHPDKGGGNETKFKEISEAYSVLGDDNKRKQYDTFGSAGPTGGSYGGNYGGFSGQDFGGFDFSQFSQGGSGQNFEFDLGDIFSEFFGGGRRVRRGRDVSIDITISFKDSIFGLDRKISLNTNRVAQKEIDLHIPAGIENGQRIRLSQMGEMIDGGTPGDLYVIIHVEKDKVFTKAGQNIITELSIKLSDALLGIKYPLQTLDGNIELLIPEGINNGETLRVRDKGVPIDDRHRGDLLIKIKVKMPNRLSRTARKLIDDLKQEGI